MKTRSLFAGAVALLAVMGLAASCAPTAPGGGVASENWQFKGTNVTVNNVQDEVCFGLCVNREDEPYLINVAFRAKIGVPGSAQAWVVSAVGDPVEDLGAGESAVLNATQQAPVTFSGVQPLDVLDVLNTNNHLEVVGVYTWAVEEDFLGVGLAASSTASLLKDALNSTLAVSSIPSDPNVILDLILDNLGNALGIAFNDIPAFGLTDDVLGGGLYIGIGARGTLASILDSAISATTFDLDVPVLTLPPDIQGGAIFAGGGTRTFSQAFSGSDGTHTYGYSFGAI